MAYSSFLCECELCLENYIPRLLMRVSIGCFRVLIAKYVTNGLSW